MEQSGKYLVRISKQSLDKYIGYRQGEKKIGEQVKILDENQPLSDNLKQLKQQSCKFALFGIPEDLGPRGNLGRGGSTGAWNAFLGKFLNVQSNQFLKGDNLIVLGHIDCSDLQEKTKNTNVNNEQELKQLREYVGEIDNRVYPVVQQIVEAGLTPIAIGGGHNNAYGMLKGYSLATKKSINAINIDPHADFRAIEGRHSGNGFSYAAKEGYLDNYHVLGLHESYNNQLMLDQVSDKLSFTSFDSIVRGEITFLDALKKGINLVQGKTCGVEIDLDCIEYMPTSAFTPSGVSSTEIRYYMTHTAKNLDTAYLHIAEGAPDLHPDGNNIIGKMVSYMVVDFIKVRLQAQQQQ